MQLRNRVFHILQAAREEADRKAQAEAAAAAQRKEAEAAAAAEEAASKQKAQAAAASKPSATGAPAQPSPGSASSSAQPAAAGAPTAAPSALAAAAALPQQRRGPQGYVPSAEAAQHAPAWDEPPLQPGVVHIHHGSHEVDFFMQARCWLMQLSLEELPVPRGTGSRPDNAQAPVSMSVCCFKRRAPVPCRARIMRVYH